jgi:hypothetical protein
VLAISQRQLIDEEILEQAIKIPGVAASLLMHKGLLAWIYQTKIFGNPVLPQVTIKTLL